MIRNNMHPHEYAYNQINIATPILNKNIFNTISCLARAPNPYFMKTPYIGYLHHVFILPPSSLSPLIFFIFFLSGWSRGCATYNVFSYLMIPST